MSFPYDCMYENDYYLLSARRFCERQGNLQAQRMQVSVPRRPLHGAEFLFRETVATIAELALRGEEGHVFEPRCDAARLATQVFKE